MSTRDRLEALVDLGDLDELVRTVDALADERDWDGLAELRRRCRAALDRGRQLWPVASLCEYRLARDAPGPWSAAVLRDDTGRFALGPLAEVAASTHEWAELAPHVPAGPLATICAHERVVRGEDLTGDHRVDPDVLDIPAVLSSWEPAYPLAVYHRDRAEFPSPPPPSFSGGVVTLPPPGPPVDDAEVTDALRGLVTPWTTASNGVVTVAAVEGTAAAAVRAVGPRAARLLEVAPSVALAWMGWAAASGGAHGRRRGAAMGRAHAWWAAVALVGLAGTGAVTADELGEAVHELRWFLWDAGEPSTGWWLRLAVEDPSEHLAWAIAASDAATA